LEIGNTMRQQQQQQQLLNEACSLHYVELVSSCEFSSTHSARFHNIMLSSKEFDAKWSDDGVPCGSQ